MKTFKETGHRVLRLTTKWEGTSTITTEELLKRIESGQVPRYGAYFENAHALKHRLRGGLVKISKDGLRSGWNGSSAYIDDSSPFSKAELSPLRPIISSKDIFFEEIPLQIQAVLDEPFSSFKTHFSENEDIFLGTDHVNRVGGFYRIDLPSGNLFGPEATFQKAKGSTKQACEEHVTLWRVIDDALAKELPLCDNVKNPLHGLRLVQDVDHVSQLKLFS